MSTSTCYDTTSCAVVKPPFDMVLSRCVDWVTVQMEAVPDTGAPDRAELLEVLRAYREALLARALEVGR